MQDVKKVYVDVDDVIRQYISGMMATYGWPSRWGRDLEGMFGSFVDLENHFRATKHATFLSNLSVMPASVKVTNLINDNPEYELEFVTATPPGGIEENVTRRWMMVNKFPDVISTFTRGHDAKIRYLANKAKYKDIVIDDYGPILEAVYDMGLPVVVAFDAPWNRHVETHRRVKTWRELERWFR